MKSKDCETCGNPIPMSRSRCPYCESIQKGTNVPISKDKIRTLNIESGKPTTGIALEKLSRGIAQAIREGIPLVRVIHGYGSTGCGGRLRDACRRDLKRRLAARKIKAVLPGEEYHSNKRATRDLMRRYPELRSTERSDTDNPGITFVEL